MTKDTGPSYLHEQALELDKADRDMHFMAGIADQVGNLYKGQSLEVVMPLLEANIGGLVADGGENTGAIYMRGVYPASGYGNVRGVYYDPDPIVGAAAAQYTANKATDGIRLRNERKAANNLEEFALSLARSGAYKTKYSALAVVVKSLETAQEGLDMQNRFTSAEASYADKVLENLKAAQAKEGLKLAAMAAGGIGAVATLSAALWRGRSK